MDISATIRALLVADAGVSAVTTNVYSDALPQRVTLPAITYFVVSTDPEHTTGATNIEAITRARIQVDALADSRSAANSLGHLIRLALDTQGRGDNDGTFVNDILLAEGEKHMFDRPESGSDRRRYVTSQDFFVWYRTTTS